MPETFLMPCCRFYRNADMRIIGKLVDGLGQVNENGAMVVHEPVRELVERCELLRYVNLSLHLYYCQSSVLRVCHWYFPSPLITLILNTSHTDLDCPSQYHLPDTSSKESLVLSGVTFRTTKQYDLISPAGTSVLSVSQLEEQDGRARRCEVVVSL